MPWIYKINLVRTLVYRIVTICSNWTIIDREIRKLTKFLQKNCFPSCVIAQAVKDVLDRFHSSKTEKYDVKKKEYRIVLHFLGNESFCIKTQLIKLFAKCYPQIDLKVVFTCKNRIGNLFQVKDFVPTMSKSHLIYKISCEACHASYVGKTINTLNERFFGGSNSGHLLLVTCMNSPLNIHSQENPGHKFNVDNIEILDQASYDDLLFTKESLHIQFEKPLLNRNIGAKTLFLF